MRTHHQVSLNQLQSLLNNLKSTTSKLSKTRGKKSVSRIPSMTSRIKRGPGRPRKHSMNTSRKGTKMVSRALVSSNNGNHHQLNRPSMAQTKRNVRSIINKLISRKNHTRSTNLANMIEKINSKSQSQSQSQSNSNTYSLSYPRKMTKCRGRQSKKPVVKSHTRSVKSYYTSSNNGSHKMERGRRIEDDSSNPFIRVNALNNGQMKSFQVSRHNIL